MVLHPPLPARFRRSREKLGRFRLLEKLGEGGMGIVYRAVDESDGSIVAVKMLQLSLRSDPNALRHLRREANMQAEVNNPYVVRLLEVNEDEGIPYLVLEFITGGTLAKLLEMRGRLPENEALNVLADVARGLAPAHERGIIHRDIKPENILLMSADEPSGACGFRYPVGFKLSDFGLAHVIGVNSLFRPARCAFLGTPLYMSPEQGSGAELVDARADVYALGATLYEIVAGRPPFQADNLRQLARMHRYDSPPTLRKLNPNLGEGICGLIHKALAKQPDQRYANAREMFRAMQFAGPQTESV